MPLLCGSSCSLIAAFLITQICALPAISGLANQGASSSLTRRERSAAAVHRGALLEATGNVLSDVVSTSELPALRDELPIPLGDIDDDRPPTSRVVPFVENHFSAEEVQRMKEAFLVAQREGRFAGINVTIYGAHGLTDSGSGWLDSTPDPYVNVSIMNKTETEYMTEVKSDSSSPVWDESYVVADFVDGDTFEFVLMDRNPYDEDTLIGRGYVASNWFFPVGFEGLVYLDDAGSRSARLHIGLAELSGEALKTEPHSGISHNLTNAEMEAGSEGDGEGKGEGDGQPQNAALRLRGALAVAALPLLLQSYI